MPEENTVPNMFRPRLFFRRDDEELRGRSSKQYIQAIGSTFVALGGASLARDTYPQGAAAADAREVAVGNAARELNDILEAYRGPDVNWEAARVWDDAFQCERLIVEVLDAPRLEIELERRILEAQSLNLPLAEFYRGRVRAPSSKDEVLGRDQIEYNRSLLGRLTRDLQWEYSQRNLKRRYAHRAQMRVCFVFLAALAVFSLVMLETFKVAKTIAEQVEGGGVDEVPIASGGADQPEEMQ